MCSMWATCLDNAEGGVTMERRECYIAPCAEILVFRPAEDLAESEFDHVFDVGDLFE